MELLLRIENVDRLPDGGPLQVEVTRRGIDFGRDQHLDWTLPDASRTISGKHCEIRFHDDSYWLTDVSVNGTYLNDSHSRLASPHRLRHGDRLTIGHYLIAVSVMDDADDGAPVHGLPPVSPGPFDPWSTDGPAALAEDYRAFRPQAAATHDDVGLDWMDLAPPQLTQTPAFRAPPSLAHQGAASSAPATTGADRGFDPLARIAQHAGISQQVIAQRNPAELAEEIGTVIRLLADNLHQLLAARAETKSIVRTRRHDVMQKVGNNPLKFSSSGEDALRIMFGPRSPRHLEATKAVDDAFGELKAHSMKLFAAMQVALEKLTEDLSPQAIESASEEGRKGLGLVVSRKARLWDSFAARWRAKAKRADGRLGEAFMRAFAESYDQAEER